MLLKTLSAAVLALGLSFSANAALIEYDWKAPGDSNVTFDTGTGLLWLDLDVTQNKSINEVADLLASDPLYAGYRFPTQEEIYALAASLFTRMSGVSIMSSVQAGSASLSEKAAHAVFGQPTAGFTYGIYSKDGVGTHLFGSGGNGLYFNYAWSSTSKDFKRSYDGVYLVSDQLSLSTTLDANTIHAQHGKPMVDVPAYTFAGAGLLLMLLSQVKRRKGSASAFK